MVAAATLAAALGRVESRADATTLAVLVALGVCFVLDDPAAVTLACSPSTLWRRRGMRLVLVLPLTALLWAIVVVVAELPTATRHASEALELATVVAVALAAAAAAARRNGDGMGGTAAGPLLLGVVFVARVLPGRWAFFPVPGHERRWLVALVVACGALLLASRDPARRGMNRSRAPVRQGG
jgi:hypothetical protein